MDFDESQPIDHCLQCGYLDFNINLDWPCPRSEKQLPKASPAVPEKNGVSVLA